MDPNDEIQELIEVSDGYAKEKQFDKTILLLLQAIEIDPNYCLSRVKLSGAYNITGEYDAAIEQLKIAFKKRPKDDPYPKEFYLFMLAVNYKTKKDYKMAIKTMNQIIKKNPLYNEAIFILVADAYFELKNFKEMSAILKKGLENFPNSVMIKANLGLAYHNLGDSTNSTKYLKVALEDCPNEADSMILVGFVHCRVGKGDIGLDLMNKAIQMNPDNAMHYGFLARAYQTLGDIPKALNAIEKFIEWNPDAAAKELKKELESLK